ncbi:amino acid adenylation domain-containing protein [Nostoc sp.]|uniref:amino acid adenylation domain-containing protein n=1 Tax=Nostoc sp. TaxID=1180 RepID=UPI002FF63C4B
MLEEMQGFRLSPQQKHLWQLQEIDNLPYRSQCAVLIEGNLDVNILKLVLEKVVNRYEILRTNFHSLPGMTIPLQVIGKQEISLDRTYDLSSLTDQDQEDSLTALFNQVRQQPFDLVQGSPLQLSLVTLSASKYVLIVSLPALCADIATLKILVQEISQSYAAWLQGEELENEPLQYADLAEWQNELLEGAETEAGRDYWQKKDISLNLQGLKLPFEKQVAEELVFKPQMQSFAIAPELIKQIDILTQHDNTSTVEFILACWQVLTWRLNKQENLTLGVAFAGRKYQDLETAIGLFAKYLPLSINIEGTSKIKDFIYKNNELIQQLDKLQDYFNWEQIAGLIPNTLRFFPLCFEFEEQPAKYVAADLSLTIYQQYACIERFKLKLSCLRQDDTLTAALHYDSSVFQAEDIKRLIEQFQTLLASAIANPDARISELEILSQIERQQLLCEVNNNQRDYPQTKCIHQLFEEQAQKTPDNIAVVFEDEQLTYAQLNSKVNQLAHHLQQQGVKAEVVVGLCTERSLEMMIGLLGILKAGGAYLPLDPTLPQASLNLHWQNIQTDIILTQQRWLDILPTDAAKVICLDTDWEVIAQNKDENPSSKATPENLVYVLFTSGSTGKPKGVAIAHQQLLNYVNAIIDRLNLPAGVNFATVSTLAADLGNTVIFPALCTGGCLHLISYQRATDSAALAEYCDKHPIDCLKIVPSHLASLLASSWAKLILPRQRLILGGEVASWQLIEQIQQYAPDCLIFNHYGPTEACVGVCTLEIVPGQVERHLAATVPLGRSIANTQVYILEEHHKLAPIGVKGEIYIGGAGLARCYLNQPDQTALKFIPHPYSDVPGARLYKTGDLGRYLPNRTIEFLGRIDNQVKIRGFRIELGEIEAVLCQHQSVREAVVVARQNQSGDAYGGLRQRRLVAYVVRDVETVSQYPKLGDLRSFLQERLPDYMLPSAFVMLKALPLTPNGKVDRNSLPAPEQVQQELEQTFLPPRNPIEQVLADIWAECLDVERVGIHDNFFDLGGHSLLATQVIYKMREAFQINLPLRSLFDAPTVAGIAERIEKTKDKTDCTLGLSIVPNRHERYQPFPLTDIQQAYWIGRNVAFELSNVATHSYREIECFNLDIERFSKAWQRLIERHDMLRAIVQPDGQQRILPQVSAYEIKVLDLRGKSLEIVASRLAEICDRMSHQVLPVDQWPLFEICATVLTDNKLRLHISFDLLIGDAWSYQIIGRELAEVMQNPNSLTTPIELSFRDYVLAEVALRDSQLYSRSLEYWQNRLATFPPSPELPLEKNLVAVTNPRFQRRTGKLEPERWQQLQRKANQAGVTPSGILLAAYAEILTVWSKSPRFTINLTLFNRLPLHPQINQVVGDFTSLNLLAIDNSGQDSFAARAKRIQQQLWDDLDHRYVSGVRVLRELAQNQERNLGALMPVVFTSTLSQDSQDLSSPLDWLGETVYSSSQTPQVYLDHVVSEAAGALVFYWNAVEELFPVGLLDEMFAAYCHLLERLANEDEIWQTQTRQLLPAAQLEQIASINATETPILETYREQFGHTPLLHTLFFDQVALHKDKAAVISNDRTLTYQELCDRSLQLRHQLHKLGTRPNQIIAIVMEKGWEQIVATLSILACGAAYLPIDPGLPTQRRWHLLQEAEVQVIITQSCLDSALEWPDSIARICADTLELSASLSQPLFDLSPTSLAYIIYTSGSTGMPKGVMIDHQGAVNTILDINQRFHAKSTDRVIALSSLSFDLSVYDIFGTLAAGGTIVIPDADAARNPEHWVKLLVKHQVTIWNSVPALMQMLLEYIGGRKEVLPASLRLVLLSGDWLPLTLPKQIRAIWENAQVLSLGGATEASIWSIFYPITSNSTWKSIPYGRPMANQRFYVLNEGLEQCPVWIPGQLYIGGIGLAQGYWKNPEKTNASFIINPQTQERLYKTGDLGRYLPDGNIEFLGREDFQVKINGYRIELGEIEAVLQQHPTIKEVVVNVFGESGKNQQLIAYIVLDQTKSPVNLHSTLQNFLQQKLPDYMVPSIYIPLDALPLTSNGKVDRRSLPVPENLRPQIHPVEAMPRTEVERLIADLWQNLLGVGQVSIYDNFFELGGNSLTAMQLAARIRNKFSVDLPLVEVFTSRTLKDLSETLEANLVSKPSEKADVISVRSQSNFLPLSFAQQRLWFLEQLQPGNVIYNFSTAVHLTGSLNVIALEQSVNEIIKRHEILRTTFSKLNGQTVQEIHDKYDLKLAIVDLTTIQNSASEIVQNLILEEQQRPFDLSNGPLLRASLLKLAETEHILLFTMHHIVSDGWSMGVITQEIVPLYTAFSTGEAATLPDLPIQYADFGIWQRKWLQGEVLETQLAYWKQQLGNNLPVMQLSDRPRADIKTRRGGSQSFVIPSQESLALQTISRQQSVTLFMTLLAGFKVLLQRYTNQDDIVIGTDVANRNLAETELLIGFFVNLLVLRTDLSGNPNFRELLGRVRQVALGAYAHQDLPFEELVKALQPERNLSNTTPLFQVLFVLQNAPMPPLELPGLTLSLLEIEHKVARFDLALFLTETEQGISGKWQYNSDLFNATTITRMTGHFQTLLNSIISQPDTQIGSLEMLTEAERKQQAIQKKERRAFNQKKLIGIIPQSVSLLPEKLVKTTYLQPGQTFPLVIQPATDDIDLVAWAKNNQEFLQTELLKHGAILFRGFNVESVLEFESFAQAISPDLFGDYGDLPRTGEGGKVYGSTPYPPDKAILFHNESSHLDQWPLKIWFFCVQPAQQGGETPIIDCRKAYKIINPKLRERLDRKQLMYVRHYTNGLDVSWQNFFRTDDKSIVENYCRQTKIDFEWYDNNSLITRQVRPALAVHPKTSEPVFFNQIQLHHIAYLDAEVRESLLSTFGDKKLPRNVYYGDGTPIEDSVIAEINEVYQQAQTSFAWQKNDILMLDNMLIAHGRNPYIGSRKVVVAMAEMIQKSEFFK